MEEHIITVSETSNPSILKFESNQFLVKGNYEFKNIDDAKDAPLPQQLFYLPFIKTVYVSGNFIALEKFNIVEWPDVKDEVAQQLVDYLNSGAPVVLEKEQKPKAVTVYAESTPNPAVMKFVANTLLVSQPYEFKNIDEAKNAPLAAKLFNFPFVKEVFLDENYVSISKYEVADWNEVTLELREMIREYLVQGLPVVDQAAQEAHEVVGIPVKEQAKDLDPISQRIVSILDEYVKPAVASDGGNIRFESYDKQTKQVQVVLQGACSGCPSSTFTLKNGIESMLKEMMGDTIGEVVAING
ncbi:NifU family protein [Sediminicola luteus]|uniref:Scaffold protein Nfu/NifU N-terminal domain-containing protein n=1 Tax=Sediminicola luteus TaxID=319238 RepID=A0A2A4G5J4_9FLAO|nr:NifU family protein [Sediminicola luteus]PCE63260.1 hypothetical protein B7P33_13620 [Sediminicola luteus]